MNGLYLFKLRGIPVFVSLWYVLLMAFFSMGIVRSAGAVYAAIFVGVVTLSLLVHEFGHGLVARRYGLTPSILLHGWGGLCAHQPAERDRDDAWIVAMGPGAGLLLGLAAWGVSLALDPAYLAARPMLAYFIDSMVQVNLFWTFINLVPMWPLDGGQLFNLGLKQKLSVARTHKITHTVGLAIAAVAVLAALAYGFFFGAILAGLLGFENWSRLRSAPAVRGKAVRQASPHARELYEQALEAMSRHDWEEAARLGHQMRTEPLSNAQLDQVWELLAVATTNQGAYEEALRYIERAPDSEAVRQASARCRERLAASGGGGDEAAA